MVARGPKQVDSFSMPDVRSGAIRHSQAAMAALFGPPEERPFDVRYWDGTEERAARSNSQGTNGTREVQFGLVINRPGALRRMLLPPNELSIVEAYLSGDVDVEGDLEAAVMLSAAISARLKSPRALGSLTRHLLALPSKDAAPNVANARAGNSVQREGHRHAKVRDRAAIQYHYDVGNDFYSLFLDERMVYSCAYFCAPTASLEVAQAAKLDLVCRKLHLCPGEKFLDVGCGWGALIMHAAEHYGVNALGITLSEQQAVLARARIAEAGLGDRCRVELRDYRDLPTRGAFDKIASVGMVEHVGIERLQEYFSALLHALAPSGLLLNHGIVNATAKGFTLAERFKQWLWRSNGFIDQYVFPDGKLGPLNRVIQAAEAVGFETRDVQSLREHYALTLREWVHRLIANRERAIALTNERVFRTWRLYMTASARGFARGELNVVQTLLAKAGANGLPLVRTV